MGRSRRARSGFRVSILLLLSLSPFLMALPAHGTLVRAFATMDAASDSDSCTPSTCVNITIVSGASSPPSCYPSCATNYLYGYSPDNVTLVLGVNNTVVWTNGDSPAVHTASSEPGDPATWDSGCIGEACTPPEPSFTFTFTVPGIYYYHCDYHPWMEGEIIVLQSTTNTKPHTATVSTTMLTSTTTVSTSGPLASAISLSESDGSTVCNTIFTTHSIVGTQWNATTSTCTILVDPLLSAPSPCITNITGYCDQTRPIDELVVDAGVTLSVQEGCKCTGVGISIGVESKLVNDGTIEVGGNLGVLDVEGTLVNNGRIVIPIPGYLQVDPRECNGSCDIGPGFVNNTVTGTIVNEYGILDGGVVTNEGTIENNGYFSNSMSPTGGNFANTGEVIGSAPCFSYDGCATFGLLTNVTSSSPPISINFNGSAILSLAFLGGTGTNVFVTMENQTSAVPEGLGVLSHGSASYYDVMEEGVSSGLARFCISSKYITSSFSGILQYWNGTDWVQMSSQTVSTSSPNTNNETAVGEPSTVTACGELPASSLQGTPIGVSNAFATQTAVATVATTTSPTTGATAKSTTSTVTSSEAVPEFTPSPYLATLAITLIVASFILARRVTFRRQ